MSHEVAEKSLHPESPSEQFNRLTDLVTHSDHDALPGEQNVVYTNSKSFAGNWRIPDASNRPQTSFHFSPLAFFVCH